MKQTASEPNGFTLIEVLVSMTILAIGLLGVAGLQITSIKGNASAINRTEASALVSDKIENYQNTPYANIAEGTETENGLGIFTRVTTIEKDTPVNDTKTVSVDVSWTDSISHTVSFQTIISKNG